MTKYSVVSLINGRRSRSLLKIWIPIVITQGFILVILLLVILVGSSIKAPIENYNDMIVTEGFHKIELPSGRLFLLSYETNHDRTFTGQIRHISMDHILQFPIISFDILVTSGDYSNPDIVSTSVSNHHFWWRSTTSDIHGTINLLHTIPMNQQMEDELMKLKVGDTVVIRGWDVQKIEAYRANGSYVGYWEDSGCNTTLITDVSVQ